MSTRCPDCGRDIDDPTTPLPAPPDGAWLADTADGFELGATTRGAEAFLYWPLALVWTGASVGKLLAVQMRSHFDIRLSMLALLSLGVGAWILSLAFLTVSGMCRLRVSGDRAELFLGLGDDGWRRRFRWSAIDTVAEERSGYRGGMEICLAGRERLRFGSLVNQARRRFLVHALRHKLHRAPLPYR